VELGSSRFDGHVDRFIQTIPWTVEKVAVAPALDIDQRRACTAGGCVPQDLHDLTAGLLA